MKIECGYELFRTNDFYDNEILHYRRYNDDHAIKKKIT